MALGAMAPCEIELPQRGAGGSQLYDACICHALAAAEVQGCQPCAAGAERPRVCRPTLRFQ